MKTIALLFTFIFLFVSFVASEENKSCQEISGSCSDCAKVKGCGFCVNADQSDCRSLSSDFSRCTASFKLDNIAECPDNGGNQSPCEPKCGEGQFCSFLAGQEPRCLCKDKCSEIETTQQETKCIPRTCPNKGETCDSDLGVCKCSENEIIKNGQCVSISCGSAIKGCEAPNTVCQDDKCVCKDGYKLIDQDKPERGCQPINCGDRCRDEKNEACVNDKCVCKEGFGRNNLGDCVEIKDGVVCSEFDTCQKCASQPECSYCSADKTCLSSVVSVNTCPNAFVTEAQCFCDCPENSSCEPNGCVCDTGYILSNERRCVKQSNPCENNSCDLDRNFECQVNSAGSPICACKKGYDHYQATSDCRKPAIQCNPDNNDCDDAVCDIHPITGDKVCCRSPYTLNNRGECKILCKPEASSDEEIYVDDISQCRCENGLVRDQVTKKCVKPCEDGSAPSDRNCGFVCPKDMAPNPDYENDKSLPPCLHICDDGQIVVSPEQCKCDHTQNIECPCPDGQVRDAGLFKRPELPPCVDKCPNTGLIPINGECPITSRCPPGYFPIKTEKGIVCGIKCWDGSFVLIGQSCPQKGCPDGLVRDRLTEQCVRPCEDGSSPYNGRCPDLCDPEVDLERCCKLFENDDPDKCPPPPCKDGYLRDTTGKCVEVCDDGNLPDPVKGCPVDTVICKRPLVEVDGKCGVYCKDKVFVEDPNKCCEEGQYYSFKLHKCICKDGTIAIGRKCPISCDPNEDKECPCPKPLIRSSNTGRCTCEDGSNPYDGNRCNTNPCPAGLFLSGRECVCFNGELPREINGEKVCLCNPSANPKCPLTKYNCALAPESRRCKCFNEELSEEECNKYDDTITIEFCRKQPNSRECFCIKHPDSYRCRFPKTCEVNPRHPSCVEVDECGIKDVLEGSCTREDFCKNNPEKDVCYCEKEKERCSFVGIDIGDTNLADIKDQYKKCASLTTKPTLENNRKCYCTLNYDPKNCFCIYNPSDKRCIRISNNNDEPKADVTKDENCLVLSSVEGKEKCKRNKKDSSNDERVSIDFTESTEEKEVEDVVSIEVPKNGNDSGILKIRRGASSGNNDVEVDSSNIDIKMLFSLDECFEFIDNNNDAIVDEGDNIISSVNLHDIEWDVKVSASDDGLFTTISAYGELDGSIFVLYYVISEDSADFDFRSKEARSTFIFWDVKYSFQAENSKLACKIRATSNTELNNFNFGDKAVIKFEDEAKVGSGVIKVVVSGPVKVDVIESDLSDDMDASDFTSYLFTVVFNTFAPSQISYDPEVITSNNPPNVKSGEQSSANSLSFSLVLFVTLLAALFN